MISFQRVASAAVLIAAMAAPALAQSRNNAADISRQEAVSVTDLNVATPSGMAAFKTRVRHAAEDVCGPSPDLRNFDESADFKTCMNKAVSDAVSALPPIQQQAARASHAG